jgi:fibro-slime domain-containing protein
VNISKAPILPILLAALAVTPSHSAKVIMLFNPWGADSTVSLGLPMSQNVSVVSYYPVNYTKGADSALMHVVPGTPWLQWSGTSIPVGFTFIRDDWSTYTPDSLGGHNSFDLTTYWATSDTVWIVPSPLPGGPAIISTTRPKQVSVFLWNPWEGISSTPPSMQVQGGAWANMHAVAGHPGWYTRFSMGLTSANLLFRDSVAGSLSYFGAAGVTALPAPAVYDSIWKKSDSVWVVATPEPSGLPVSFSTWPTPKVVEIFNPWDSLPTMDIPRVQFPGDTTHFPTSARPDICGWYERIWYTRPASILVSSSVTGQTWGSGGLGTTGSIDLSVQLATHDTVWVGKDASGKPLPSYSWDGTQGQCLLVMLAATIRDFNYTDSSFQQAGSCGNTGYVQSLLGPGRKPVPTGKIDQGCNPGDSARMANYWFTTDPTYTHSAETCRDIPLQMDTTGNYTYNNQLFFPIDDFTTLPNGNANPFNVQYGADDNLPHNFNFCLEMHGTFDSRKGQNFNFIGDDDVWFFINGKLAVDLGGVHGPEAGSVNLDTLGLTYGQTYPWDMFYCERHTSGSSIKISTSMNLKTLPTFSVADSTLGLAHHLYTLWVNTKSGTSCASSAAQRNTAGLYTLTGTGLTGPQILSVGTWYGGIQIPTDLASVSLDSSAIAGLAPGMYVLHIALQGNAGTTRDIPFTVPDRDLPRYLNPVPDSGVTGTSFPVTVISSLSGQRDSIAVGFTTAPPAGLAIFRDSLLTIPVTGADTFHTGSKGESVRLWAQGTQPGSWKLVLRSTRGDSTDVWAFVVVAPVPRIPKYLNPSGYAGAVGTGSPLDVITTQGGKRDTTSVGFTLVPPSGLALFRDSLFQVPLKSTDTLRTGPEGQSVRIWAEGIQVGSWTLVLRNVAGDSVDVSPALVFSGRGIRFTDSTGKLTALPALVADIHQAVAVYLQSFIGTNVCSTCGDSVTLVTGNVHLRILASPTGPEITGVRLSGGKAEFWVASSLPIDSTRITAQSDSAQFPVDRSPVKVLAPRLVFVDSLGQEISPLPPLVLGLGEKRTLRVEVLTSTGLCSACSDTVSLAASSNRLLFQDPQGNAISRIVLSGGTASFVLTGWAPVQDASISADADNLLAKASWSPISISTPVVDGLLTDSDVDGRADLLLLQLPVDAAFFQGVRIQWPDTSGVIESRNVPLSTTGQNPSVAIPPFAFGATSCPAAGCTNLGQMEIVRGTDTALIPFAVRDGVVPVIVAANLRYASSTSIRDTLRVRVSEPLQPGTGKPWVSWGRASIDSLGIPLDQSLGGLTGDPRDLYFLVDSTFLPDPLDSIRLTASPTGAASDVPGNVPVRFANWAPVDRGPYPSNLSWVVHQGFHAGNGQNTVGEPDIQILTQRDSGVWTPLGQTAANQSPDEYTGLRLHMTKGVQGSVYIYDNLGVFVGGMTIPSLDQDIDQKTIPSDSRGNTWIWLAWNGRRDGKAVPGGVYLMRVLLTTETQPRKVLLNHVFPLGLKRGR